MDIRSFHLKGPFLSPSVILFTGPFINKGLGHHRPLIQRLFMMMNQSMRAESLD